MTLYGSWSRWAAGLALGLAALIGVGTATVLAAPARPAAGAWELTLEGRDTVQWQNDDAIREAKREGAFRSRAPFCATGTFVDEHAPIGGHPVGAWRFTCDDGTGSLTVSIGPVASWLAPSSTTTWYILDGSGRYAGLRGRGTLRGERLGREIFPFHSVETWRMSFVGIADRDAVAPRITLARATAAKLPRRPGAYMLRVGIALRDNFADNAVSYTLRASVGGVELARRLGTAGTERVSIALRIRPPAGARTVGLQLTGEDPIGNLVSVRRVLRLPR